MTIEKAKELLQRAGFNTYNETMLNGHRPYICYKHDDCNSFTGLLYTDQPDNTILEIIFSECKKVGRIQLRQRLNHLIYLNNYE